MSNLTDCAFIVHSKILEQKNDRLHIHQRSPMSIYLFMVFCFDIWELWLSGIEITVDDALYFVFLWQTDTEQSGAEGNRHI